MEITNLTLNDFIVAAARNNDKALRFSQTGVLSDVKVKNPTDAEKSEAQDLRRQLAAVLSDAYRSAGVELAKINEIRSSLGVGHVGAEDQQISTEPLTSREVRNALMAAQHELGDDGIRLIYDEVADLKKCGLYDADCDHLARKTVMNGPLATVAGMTTALKEVLKARPDVGICGLTSKNAETFVKTNFAQLKQLAFDYVYRSSYAEGKTVGPAVALASAALRLMNAYGSREGGLKPGVMPLTWSMKLVMGEQPPVIEKTPQLAAKCPLPASMQAMLDGLRSHSHGNSPTARRLGVIADRLEAEWFRVAGGQNGEDLGKATLAAFKDMFRGKLGDEGLRFLFEDCDWHEIGIRGDGFLRMLDSQLVVKLSKEGAGVKPELGDIAKVLLDSARDAMKQDNVKFLARELATEAILAACKEGGVKISEFESNGKVKEIYDLAEKFVQPKQDDGTACPDEIKPLFTAALDKADICADGLRGTSDPDLQRAFAFLKDRIGGLVTDKMALARNRDNAFAEAGAALDLMYDNVGNKDLRTGKDAEAIHCKLVLLSLYLSEDQLKEDKDLNQAVNGRGYAGDPKVTDETQKEQAKAEWASRLLDKVNARLNTIPDDWLLPMMNALKIGMYFESPNNAMIPAVLDGIGKANVPPQLSIILSQFSHRNFTSLLSTIVALENFPSVNDQPEGPKPVDPKGNGPRVEYKITREMYEAYYQRLIEWAKGNKAVNGFNEDISIGTCALADGKRVEDVTCNEHLGKILEELSTAYMFEQDHALPNDVDKIGPKGILSLAKSCGLGPEDLGTDVGIAKLMLIKLLLQAKRGSADELAEWSQRMFGIDLRTIRPDALAAAAVTVTEYLIINAKAGTGQTDPLAKLAKGNPPIDFLSGRRKFEESGLPDGEIGGLISVLGTIKKGGEPQTCVLGGIEYSVANAPDGKSTVFTMTGKAKGSQPLQVRFPQSPADFLTFLQMQIASKKDTQAGVLLKLIENLGDVRQSEMPVARARELLVRILSARTEQPSVAFSSLSQEKLHDLTMAVLRGETVNVPEATGYYSDEAKVQLSAWDAASKVDTSKVNMLSQRVDKSADERRLTAQNPQSVRALFGELFMNSDVTLFDAEERVGAKKGERMLAFVKANLIELEVLVAASDDAKSANTVPGWLSGLPPPLRDGAEKLISVSLKGLLGKLNDTDKDAMLAACREAEKQVDKLADEVMAGLQNKVGGLFPDRPDESGRQADWKVPLKADGVRGIDVGSPEGRIVSTVLKHYFTDCSRLEKRAMMASFARNAIAGAGGEPSDGEQVAAALKGAGPVLQKMMQGLPLESFGPETQKAIKDMKCNLLPIPDSVIRAQLLDLVRNSNGEILSVQVMKPIGSATVAQALLCHIKTKDAPYTGKDVVIKLQRPNSQLAALRERDLISGILKTHVPEAGRQPLLDTFKKQFDGILEEFDFTIEAENIDVGHDNYNMVDKDHTSVHSMDRYRAIMPNTGVLVLEKIEGNTLESSVDKLAKPFVHEGVERKSYAASADGPVQERLEAKDAQTLADARRQIKETHEKLLRQRESMVGLIDLWFSKGLLTDGFFHADLHAGNMMSTMKENATGKLCCDVTFIDFGNVQRMTAAEQTNLVNLVLCCGQNVPDKGASSFVSQLEKMVPGLRKKHSSEDLDKLKAALGGIFRKGGSDMLFAKLGAAVSAAQSFGISLPSSVGAFLASVMRLRNGLASIDAALAACEQESAKLVLNPLLDQQIAAEQAGKALDTSPRKSFEGVLVDVMAKHSEELQTKADFILGKQFIYASRLDDKNKKLQEQAVQTVKAKSPGNDLANAKTVETICAYVDSFVMPGGVYAMSFGKEKPLDVLNFFVTELCKRLGRTHLEEPEIAIAADMLKARKIGELPRVRLPLLAPKCDLNLIGTKDHPLLQAFKDLGRSDANRGGCNPDAIRIAQKIAEQP